MNALPLSTQAPAADRLDRRGWAALLVLCGVLFLDGLDVSMVGIALPSIERDLHLSTTTLQWVVSGLVLGGLLTTAGWRYTFLLPVPIALALLAVAPRFLRPDEPSERVDGRFDFAGAALITGAMMALVYGVSDAPNAGWASARTLVA